MLQSLLFALALACFQRTIAAAEHLRVYSTPGIEYLNRRTLEDLTTQADHLFVFFQVRWCKHSLQFSEEFIKASRQARRMKLAVTFAVVDPLDSDYLQRKFGVEAHPGAIFFVKQIPVFYEGPRDSKSIVRWLKRRSQNPIIQVHNSQEILQQVTPRRLALVYYGDVTHQMFAVFLHHAQTASKRLRFYQVVPSANSRYSSYSQGWMIKLFRSWEEKEIQLDYTFSTHTKAYNYIKLFLERFSSPIMTRLSKDRSVMSIFQQPGTWLLHFNNNPSIDSDLVMSKVIFRQSDQIKAATLSINSPLAEYLDIASDSEPQHWIISTWNEEIVKYKLYNSADESGLQNFVNRFFSGRMSPDNPIINDEDILLELESKVQLDFQRTQKQYVVLHYNKSNCTRGSNCDLSLKLFKKMAQDLHFVPDLEFALLNYAFETPNKCPLRIADSVAPKPIMGVFTRQTRAQIFLPQFDYSQVSIAHLAGVLNLSFSPKDHFVILPVV